MNVSGATTTITRRTTLRKSFLSPWDPLVQQCWLYALADAQRQTGVAIHHGNLVINHEHLIVTPSYGNLHEFTRRLHRDVSCALNTLLAHHRYDAPVRLTRCRPAPGARAVQRIHPWSEPRSLRERGGGLVLPFSVGQRGRAGREKTVRASLSVRGFRRSHHEARVAHRDGERSRRFPFGTYAMRTMHGVPVEPSAYPQAIVAQPGPLLCDAQARLREKRRSSEDARVRSISLMESVRAELEHEAGEAEEMDGWISPPGPRSCTSMPPVSWSVHGSPSLFAPARGRGLLFPALAAAFGPQFGPSATAHRLTARCDYQAHRSRNHLGISASCRTFMQAHAVHSASLCSPTP